MGQYVFGTGSLTVQNVGGGQPLKFASLLDVSVDISGDIKEMNGQYTFPQAVARGKSKIQCKATSGQFDVSLFNQTFFGQTVTAGSTGFAQGESHAIPTTPYQVTATNGATFVQDMGVVYAATGVSLKQVGSPSAIGQYSVNSATGVYTFFSGDTGSAVLINYTYTSGGGHTLAINNQLMGLAPTFQCTLGDSFNNNGGVQSLVLTLYACTASKLSMPLKADDFLQSDIEWQAQSNSAGQVGFISQAVLTLGGAALSLSGTPPSTGTVGTAYNFTPTASGGAGGYVFNQTGTLPPGLSFSSSTGAISGTPTTAGTYAGLAITVTDSASNTAQLAANPFTITVSSGGGSPSLDFSQASDSQYEQIAQGE